MMLKSLTPRLLGLLLMFFFRIEALNASSIQCSPSLKKCLNAIQSLPEGKQLIQKVLKEGSIRILTTNSSLSKEFGAFWEPYSRMIFINPAAHQTLGEMITSLLFELHNAASTNQINQYNAQATARKITRAHYVELIERLEYQNAIETAQITKKAINRGVFPKSAYLKTFHNFEEHFHFQKKSGHSAWIAHNFDQLARRFY
jgi:hypothetical protein